MADYLIIGNGPAGRKAAETLIAKAPGKTVLMITDERCPHYPRPRLSLGYLSGEVQRDALFTAPDFYSRKGVSLLFGRVARVSPEAGRVELDDGSVVSFGKLLIASGASPTVPPWEGGTLDGVMTLRTVFDADRIIERVDPVEAAVVAGGGILGVEVAEAIRKRGKKVALLVRGGKDKVGAPSLDPEKAVNRCDKMIGGGIEVMCGEEVARLEGENGALKRVVTSSGNVLDTSVLVVAIGARSNISFLSGSGIATGRGVVVDSELRSAARNVFAAGDCAEVTGDDVAKQQYGSPYINASKQGEHAAMRMLED